MGGTLAAKEQGFQQNDIQNAAYEYQRSVETGQSIFFFQAEDGIRDGTVTGVQTCALPILCAANTASPHFAKSSPKPAANNDNAMLSVTSCRISLPRRAPNAIRMAISFQRPAARASCMLATFTQAMRRTNSAAPSTRAA